MSDPAKYRTREEVDAVKEKSDPIENLRRKLIEQGAADEEHLKEIDREVREIVAESARFAQESPEPPESELMQHIYVDDAA
jgi:pyruvate dehydrogenase E1 component alpha subunit